MMFLDCICEYTEGITELSSLTFDRIQRCFALVIVFVNRLRSYFPYMVFHRLHFV